MSLFKLSCGLTSGGGGDYFHFGIKGLVLAGQPRKDSMLVVTNRFCGIMLKSHLILQNLVDPFDCIILIACHYYGDQHMEYKGM